MADLQEVAAHLPARRRPSAHLSPGGRNQRRPPTPFVKETPLTLVVELLDSMGHGDLAR